MMDATEIVRKAQDEFTRLGKKQIDGVAGLARKEDDWVVSLEAVEKKAIPDAMDVLGLYEMRLDTDGNLQSIERKRLRKRGDTGE